MAFLIGNNSNNKNIVAAPNALVAKLKVPHLDNISQINTNPGFALFNGGIAINKGVSIGYSSGVFGGIWGNGSKALGIGLKGANPILKFAYQF